MTVLSNAKIDTAVKDLSINYSSLKNNVGVVENILDEMRVLKKEEEEVKVIEDEAQTPAKASKT